jgi:hypothetical protein
MRDEGSDADDRVINVLRKLVADRLADFYVGLADKIVGGRKPGDVGHGLQVPHDDAWFHAGRISPRLRIGKPLAVWKLQYRCAGLSSSEFAARPLVQAREPATGIIVIDIPAVLDCAGAINNLSGLILRS